MKVFWLYSPWAWKCPCPWAWSWLCAAPCFNSWLWQWSAWPCGWSRAPLKREWLCPWPKNKVCKDNRHVKMYYLMVTIILTLAKRMSAKPRFSSINIYLSKVLKWRCSVTQLCPTLCDPMDCGLRGSSVHGMDFPGKNTRVGCISYSRGSSWPRDQTHVSDISCTGRWIRYHWAT